MYHDLLCKHLMAVPAGIKTYETTKIQHYLQPQHSARKACILRQEIRFGMKQNSINRVTFVSELYTRINITQYFPDLLLFVCIDGVDYKSHPLPDSFSWQTKRVFIRHIAHLCSTHYLILEGKLYFVFLEQQDTRCTIEHGPV